MTEDNSLATFVARIWLERGTENNVMWRGHIRHVQGKAETYFNDFADMGAFLEQISGTPSPLSEHKETIE